MIDFNHIKRAHFIGIGGIGISAIARMLLARGVVVTGSDTSDSPIIHELKRHGARVRIGHAARNLGRPDVVIYTIAISKNNPELVRAHALKIPTFTYPQALGALTRTHFTIAVCGTHGKTTTTAMIAKIMIDAGLDPTVIVGSVLKDQKSNFVAGKSKYLVVEACEYRRSFLNLHPDIIAITNIDKDHLDYYKDLADIKRAFKQFEGKLKPGGKVVQRAKLKAQSFQLKLPGSHNQMNAHLAWRVARALKIPEAAAVKSLENFAGTWRRFEYKGKTKKGSLVYDDYGHHPTEIRATLAGAREMFPKRKIIAAFQPHLYSRTKILLNDFARAFRGADEVLLLPIYAAREKSDPSITSKMLAAKIPGARFFPNNVKIQQYLLPRASRGDVIITIGAGDVYKFAEVLTKGNTM